MKTKIVFLIAFVIGFANAMYAQDNSSRIGFGVELGLPSGNFSGISSVGLGGSVKVDFNIAEKWGLSLNAGVVSFLGKNNFSVKIPTKTYLPFKGGLKYIMRKGFYIEGQLGASVPTETGDYTMFVLSPGVGNYFRNTNGSIIDFGIRYENWLGGKSMVGVNDAVSSKGFIGIRISYGLNL